MNKKCARPECGKTVYQLEELKCLDKTWHKLCFKCTVCGMALNMKNYKGFNKMPYCEPHYPKTVASVVTDTPEMIRLAEQSKNQSQVHYHAEFEKMKGTKTSVADDPELNRLLQNSKVVSQAEYHGEAEKREKMDKIRPPLEETVNQQPDIFGFNGNNPQNNNGHPVHPQAANNNGGHPQYPQGLMNNNNNNGQQMNHHHHHHHNSNNDDEQHPSFNQLQRQHQQNIIYSSESGHRGGVPSAAGGAGAGGSANRPVGSLDDYDPLNGQWGSINQSSVSNNNNKQPFNKFANHQQQQQQQQQIRQPTQQQQKQQQKHNPQQPPQQQPQQMMNKRQPGKLQHSWNPQQPNNKRGPPQKQQQQQQQPRRGPLYRAMYDYTAADTDEVTFVEGDVIGGCEFVDEGWMTGTVQRTKQWGMLPANYVEKVN